MLIGPTDDGLLFAIRFNALPPCWFDGIRGTTLVSCHRHVAPSGKSDSDFRKSCQAPKSKIFRLPFRQIRIISSPSHPRGGALAIVTKRWDGMRWTLAASGAISRRTKRCPRTAKSCGPGAAMLALSLAEQSPRGDGDNKPAHRGEHDISRKAIAQGMSECSPLTCMLVCAFLCATWHTRPRVQRAPGIPCALCFGEGK